MDSMYTEIMRIFIILALLSLSACNSVKKTMGILKETPDEYTVLPQKKLEIPEDLDLPEPDQDGATLDLQTDTDDTRILLVGSSHSSQKTTNDTKAEQALLEHLPIQRQNDIRKLLNQDMKKPESKNLLFWQRQVKGKPLDAEAEAERLKVSHETVSPRP